MKLPSKALHGGHVIYAKLNVYFAVSIVAQTISRLPFFRFPFIRLRSMYTSFHYMSLSICPPPLTYSLFVSFCVYLSLSPTSTTISFIVGMYSVCMYLTPKTSYANIVPFLCIGKVCGIPFRKYNSLVHRNMLFT